MAELQKPLVKYFALSLKPGVSFAGVVHIDGAAGWSWQDRPGVPSLDPAGVRERARGGHLLLWNMSGPFLSGIGEGDIHF